MWLHVPTTCFPSVPDREPSTLELELHAQALAQSAWSSGVLTKPSFWLRAWRKGTYPRLRSGATQAPSTLSLGVESWIVSLRETRASPTVSPGSNSAPATTDGFSTTCCASSRASGLVVSSVRTSLGTPMGKSATSSQHWKAWVTALRAEYSAREPAEPDNPESGCLSWPTVTARDHRSPNSQDSQDRRNAGSKRGQQLMNFIAWELPKVWSTLTAAAAHGSQLTRGNERSNELLIGGQAVLVCLLHDPTTPHGATLSMTRLALNPQFAEWLMGWPIGWSALRPLETELSPWLSQSRGLALRLASPPPPMQRSLFD